MTVGDLPWESPPLYLHPSGLWYLSLLFAAISKSQGKSCFRWPDTKFSVLRHISEQVMRVAVCETRRRRRRRPGWYSPQLPLLSTTAHGFPLQALIDWYHWIPILLQFMAKEAVNDCCHAHVIFLISAGFEYVSSAENTPYHSTSRIASDAAARHLHCLRPIWVSRSSDNTTNFFYFLDNFFYFFNEKVRHSY